MFRPIFYSRLFSFSAAFFLAFSTLTAQEHRAARETALKYLQQHYSTLKLSQQDVADTRITDAYATEGNGLTHVWIQQQHLGIPVFNALIGLHTSADGRVYQVGHRFVQELARKVNTTIPSLSASQALEMGIAHLGLQQPLPSLKTKINEKNWVFEGGNISRGDIPVRAVFVNLQDQGVRLAWSLVVDQVNSSDWWTIFVDAQTGLVLRKINHTTYCKVDHLGHEAGVCAEHTSAPETAVPASPELLADERYRVFALPVESPNHGVRTLETNPADLVASPFGWLDTNGVEGHEFTYTRGNNVWAFEDRMNDNTPSEAESAFGGPNLNFDFAYDPAGSPIQNRQAATTNLFYLNNKMHDFTYRYGFNEAAGNFQVKNYTNQGLGRDAVLAQSLDGSELPEPTLNNANFATPPDGNSGRMQMFLWNTTGGGIVQVNAPQELIGTYFGGQGGWGGAVTNTPLTADVVFVNNGLGNTFACQPPNNDVSGKIVMVDRGACDFSEKAYHMQEAGAVACIICDHESPPLSGFGAGDYADQVTIPALYMRKAICDILRQQAGQGLNISLVQPTVAGPAFVDGDFDNGIIAHEFGHGVSNRLTGGPAQAGCLSNPEQMGEGWSDFFTLVTTVRPGDDANTKRGVGTFVFRQPVDANGIRRYPYTTDMSVNPVTYSTIALNPEVHALGEIWTAMLWDLYWAMVEKYGYDPDINNLNSGNARALLLVMDGMKIQPCDPGFVDGRNAIMTADIARYQGVDTCLISTVFARRGLGYLADQKEPYSAVDGVENFDPIPVCVKEIKIKKVTSTPVLEPGDNAEFTITITNHKGEVANNVVVTDELPAGLSLVSASNGGALNGNMVVWNLGNMADGQVINLTYTAKSDPMIGSSRYFYDPMDSDENWFSISYHPDNVELFELQSDDVYQGTGAWRAPEPNNLETNFALETTQQVTISGIQPTLRFWHKYETQPSADAGFLEFLDVNDPNADWQRVTNEVTFRNGYPLKVAYGTGFPFAYPNHYGFSGSSNGWVQSYFDMSQYLGKTLNFRFRFGTNSTTAPDNGGWVIDELEFMDIVNYDTEACVTTGTDQACDRADARGIILGVPTVGTTDLTGSEQLMQLQPNPAKAFFSVTMKTELTGAVSMSLITLDGRTVVNKQLSGVQTGQVVAFDVQHLPAGMYLLQLENAAAKSQAKVVLFR